MRRCDPHRADGVLHTLISGCRLRVAAEGSLRALDRRLRRSLQPVRGLGSIHDMENVIESPHSWTCAPCVIGMMLALAACGGPASAPDSGPSVDSGTAMRDAGTMLDGSAARDGGSGRDGGSSGGNAPIIRMIVWTHGTPCGNRNRAVTIEATVEDADTPATDLVFSGYVGGCTGALDAATSTVSCNGTSPTIAFVHVEDEGGRADDQAVNIEYCVDGSREF